MKNKSLIFSAFLSIAICALAIFNSCSKEDDNLIEQNVTEEPVLEEPFFNVEKGDSVSKEVHRAKPEFGSEVTVLYSSEDNETNLKSSLAATSYITDLYILLSDVSSAAPPWMYTKINVDLNEGAGGKWIFLCYTKESGQSPIRDMKLWAGGRDPSPRINSPWTVVTNSDGYGYPGADLNKGAGGDWIYLYENRSTSCGAPIKSIAIISTSSSSYSPCCGWTIVNRIGGKVDVNKGAGGKYIYILYKK